MISIELWRAKIGLFNCSRRSRPSSISNLQQQTTHGWFSFLSGGGGLFSSLCRSLLIRRALALLIVAVITHLLLSAGDVERNPGPITGSPLTVKDLLEAVSNVTDWYSLGVQLGLTMSQLRGIELTYPRDGLTRLKAEMFNVWLKSSPNASWTDLITALRAIDEHRVANDIEAVYTPAAAVGVRVGRVIQTDSPDGRWCRTAAVSVLAVLVTVSIAFILNLLPAATPPTPPSSSSTRHPVTALNEFATPSTPPSSSSSTPNRVTSVTALLNEFDNVYIDEPLALCSYLSNVRYKDCQRIVDDHKTNSATVHKIVAVWFDQSPQLTWEDVVDTLFQYGRVKRSTIEIANRHGVDMGNQD